MSKTFTAQLSGPTGDLPDMNPGDGFCETDSPMGDCTLRAAIMEANALPGADIIELNYSPTLTLTGLEEDGAATGDLDITDDLTINGTGATVIDGGGIDRVFHIDPNDNATAVVVELNDLTITNGDPGCEPNAMATLGGGILSLGDLTLNNVTVSNNTHTPACGNALDYSAGGGIYQDGDTLDITSSVITGNSTGSSGSGGGIYIKNSDVSISSTEISGNRADGQAGSGGAVYSVGTSGTLMIGNSTISDNTAANSGGGLYSSLHAAIYASTIENNKAVDGSVTTIIGTDGGGGGIFATGYLQLLESTVQGNSTGYDNAAGHSNAPGGGIYLSPTAGKTTTATIERSTISGNHADYHRGGGIYIVDNSRDIEIVNSTIYGNWSRFDGGGIFFTSSGSNRVILSNATIADNTAGVGGGEDKANLLGVYGGGIAVADGTTAELQLTNTLFSRNHEAYTATYGGQANDCSGSVTTNNYNVIESINGWILGSQTAQVSCSLSGSGTNDIIGQSAMLASGLDDNKYSASVKTVALLGGSPAIDAGNETGCLDASGSSISLDQRGTGFSRSYDGNQDGVARCDIGAYEFGAGGLIVADTSNLTVAEDAGTFSVNVEFFNPQAHEETWVYYDTADTSAAEGVDYSLQQNSPVALWADFADYASSGIWFDITDDSTYTGDRDFTLSLSNGELSTPGVDLLDGGPFTVTITEDDLYGELNFASASYNVDENAGTVTVTVTRTNGSVGEVSVQVGIASGTATVVEDFVDPTQTLLFADGVLSQDVIVTLNNDGLDEGEERLVLGLKSATGGAIVGSTSFANIYIADDDTTPVITASQSFSVAEDVAVGSVVATVVASDADGDVISEFTITGTDFSIDSNGVIRVASALDYETTNSYGLDVTASDGTNSSTESVSITVTDVTNEHAPTILGTSATIAEDAVIGSSVVTVSGSDLDGDTVSYTITAGDASGNFAIDTATGEITVASALDYETTTVYKLTVEASDGEKSTTATVTVNVTDVDDTTDDATDDSTDDTTDGTATSSGGGGGGSFDLLLLGLIGASLFGRGRRRKAA